MATTFINRKADLSVLADLKHLLVEAGQELPIFLQQLAGEEEVAIQGGSGDASEKGCAYCSGLGHRITNCPKLEGLSRKVCFICRILVIFFLKNAASLLRPDFEAQEGL